MSNTATATPTADLSLADALDAGIDAIDRGPQEAPVTAPVQATPEPVKAVETAKEAVVDKTNSVENTNPLDVLTKRLTGQEETSKTKASSEELDVKTPENLKPEAQTAWARLTKDLRDARAKIKELETKTAEAPVNSTEQIDLKAQLDALKSERDEYEQELRFSRLEATREYKQAVTEPLSVIQKEVAEIAKLYEADPRLIYSAMVEPDAAKRRALLKEATSAFDPVDSLAVRNKAEELQKVFERRDVLTKDVKTVLEMLENEEKSEMEAFQKRSQEEISSAYKAEWDALQQENPLLRPIEDNEAWNNTLNSIQSKALEIENTELDPRSKARLTFNAAAMPVVMQVFQDYVSKTQSRINELEKTAKELRATLPSSGSESGSAPEIASDLGFLEALERGMSKK
jgi:hypothetical protein